MMYNIFQLLIPGAIAAAGVVISNASVRISQQQKRLADVRLQNDLFDRRFKIFEATRELIWAACRNPNVAFVEMQAFAANTATAPFFFGQEVVDYLNDLYRRVSRLNQLCAALDLHEPGQNRAAVVAEKTDIQTWLVAETAGIVSRFRPFMALNALPLM